MSKLFKNSVNKSQRGNPLTNKKCIVFYMDVQFQQWFIHNSILGGGWDNVFMNIFLPL